MKSIRPATIILMLALASTAHGATIEMEVNGLVCAFCAQGIEKSLERFPAVDEVLVSLEHRTVAVALKEGKSIEDAALRKAIIDAGYSVVSLRHSDDSLEEVRRRIDADAGSHD